MRARHSLEAIAIAGAAVLCFGVSSAQGRGAKVIVGKVTDSATHAALAGATISVVGRGSDVVTGADGSFSIPTPPGSRVHLVVERGGYEARALSLDVAGDTTRAAIALAASTAPAATAAVPVAPGRTNEFDRRLKSGMGGTFITRADVERRQPRSTAELLRSTASVSVLDTMGTQLIVSSRGGMMSMGSGRRSEPMPRCVLSVGVDGRLQPLGFSVNLIVPEDVYGIEVFGGPSSIPTEYSGTRADGDCGLVMIWTREH